MKSKCGGFDKRKFENERILLNDLRSRSFHHPQLTPNDAAFYHHQQQQSQPASVARYGSCSNLSLVADDNGQLVLYEGKGGAGTIFQQDFYAIASKQQQRNSMLLDPAQVTVAWAISSCCLVCKSIF